MLDFLKAIGAEQFAKQFEYWLSNSTCLTGKGETVRDTAERRGSESLQGSSGGSNNIDRSVSTNSSRAGARVGLSTTMTPQLTVVPTKTMKLFMSISR